MSIGDALKDMPEEYREYVETKEPEEDQRCGTCAHWRDAVCSSPDVDTNLWTGTRSRSTVDEGFNCGAHWRAIGDSEADKAIADGKPRWIYHPAFSEWGWEHVLISERVPYGAEYTIRYRLANAAVGREYMMLMTNKLKILPYGETPPPAEPEKPKAVASIVFKHDGGEWIHMAEQVDIENPSYGVGAEPYTASPLFIIALSDKRLGYVPQMEGMGTLTVTILEDGNVYKGAAYIHARDDSMAVDESRTNLIVFKTDRIVFKMERDAEPAYEPETLYGDPCRVTGLPLCPDCDVPTESRSMPDGIEQWCPVCNVKVDTKTVDKKPVATLDDLRYELELNAGEDLRVDIETMHIFIDELEKSQSENRMRISM